MFYVIAGSLIASLALSYGWWTKVRVIRLRQVIFDERDALFDEAMSLGALSDPAYRAARRHLNSVANVAGIITLDLLFFVRDRGGAERPIPETTNPDLCRAIDRALDRCADSIVRSLLYETFIGLVLVFRFRIRGFVSLVEPRFKAWCYRWITSRGPEKYDQIRATCASVG